MTKTPVPADPFNARDSFDTGSGKAVLYRLDRLEQAGLCKLSDLPFSIRVLLESVLRNCDGFAVTEQDVKNMAGWKAGKASNDEIPFKPSRVVLQDFTGVPAVVDLAAMRGAMNRLGGKPSKINPLIPVDLVIDHSVQVDFFGSDDALEKNVEVEYQRNRERYEFLRWGQQAFDNFRAIPPNVGIVHQVNLEYLARVVWTSTDANGDLVAYPDTLVGTDSHTTMINGLGVLGWGVGGIEAEAAMLGQPLYMLMPEVVGMEISGSMPAGTTATDLVLRVTEILRKEGVVNKFVEFFGPGISNMSLADRATIANMAPEYGATMGFFPVDAETLNYMRRTGREEALVQLVERYCKEQHLFRSDSDAPATYSKTVKLDLSTIEPALAGPKRPQDRVTLSKMQETFRKSLVAPITERGFGLSEQALARTAQFKNNGKSTTMKHGAVVIAAITSCTNTSNPSVMLGAGLLAKKAVQRGLKVPAYVKTSLAPGSRVVTDYLVRANVLDSLRELGFHVVGYGCTTCIGNSGPLPTEVADSVTEGDLVASAVLSGNRNFEGRVNPLTKANYLASPPLVVAYALAGTTDIDLINDPIGYDPAGAPVYLKEIWPSREEVAAAVESSINPEMFRHEYSESVKGDLRWQSIESATGDIYAWDEKSTYIQEPPFLSDVVLVPSETKPLHGARVLLMLGDSVTTDHISPAGSIAKDSPAGRYLRENGVEPREFNSYGSRRGNDRVMVRGTFANIRIRNFVAPGTEGGWTRHLPDGEVMSVYDAAEKYRAEGVPLVVIAGAEYGTGSSRDWAAKGTLLLGVRAVIATSYERIHRSNLVGMGVLPLEFKPGTTWQTLKLTGEETIEVSGLDYSLKPRGEVMVTATGVDGSVKKFPCTVRIDTPVELEYYRHGGILPAVLRKLATQ